MSNKNASTGEFGFEPKQLLVLAEAYIKHCIENERLPNLAGLCRYLDISVEAFSQLPANYHEQIAKIRDALEDEALNSGMPPSLLGSYLKRLLGDDSNAEREGELIVVFDHDADTDGE